MAIISAAIDLNGGKILFKPDIHSVVFTFLELEEPSVDKKLFV